jgi:hypothetical protein
MCSCGQSKRLSAQWFPGFFEGYSEPASNDRVVEEPFEKISVSTILVSRGVYERVGEVFQVFP